jgi:hypothetical protein
LLHTKKTVRKQQRAVGLWRRCLSNCTVCRADARRR